MVVTIAIRVDEQLQKQFDAFDEQQRAEVEASVAQAIRKQSIQQMFARMDRMAEQAERNGLTPEILEEILNDDDDE